MAEDKGFGNSKLKAMEEDYKNLTDEELLAKAREIKKSKSRDRFIVGFLVGIAIVSTIKDGISIYTFIPGIYAPFVSRNQKKRQHIKNLLEERGLN